MRAAAGAAVAAAALACGGNSVHSVLEPPRFNLLQYRSVGLVNFSIEHAKDSLNDFATHRFEESILGAQPGFEVREFSYSDSATALTGGGGEHPVPVVFYGHLKVSNVKPRGGLIALAIPHVEATVDAELSVWLISTSTGGVLWRSSAAATEKVGDLAIVDGIPSFSARDPNDAYGVLVNRLVRAVTYDFRSTWVTAP
ncbi:MAG TPA: hypothetical protein VI160_03330 [Gemmatimonadales bacterium]